MIKTSGKNVWFGDKRDFPEFSILIDILTFLKKFLPNYSWNLNSFFNGNLTNSDDEKRPVRLRNIGLNCYLNSSFQSIAACATFVEEMKLLEAKYPASSMLRVFNKILWSLSNSGDEDVELSGNEILRMWNKPGEQDTFELLSYVIFQVFNDLRRLNQEDLHPNDRTIDNWNKERLPLKLLIEFNIKCRCGYNFVPSLQTDLALHLSVPFRIFSDSSQFTIEYLLDSYFTPELISDFPCSSANCSNGEITKLIVLQKPMPNTLCLHIQRSYWNSGTNRMEKNNEKIGFSEKLVLKNEFFSIDRCKNRNGRISGRVIAELIQSGDLFGEDHAITDQINELVKEEINIDRNSQLGSNEKNDERIQIDLNDSPQSEEIKENITIVDLSKSDTSVSQTDGFDKINGDNVNNIDVVNRHNNISVNGDEIENDQKYFITKMEIDKNDFEKIKPDCEAISKSGLKDEKECSIKHENQPNDNNSHSEMSDFNEIEQYYLKSVIVHFGRAESGHYICYGKYGNKWFCTNDNFITEVSFEEVRNSQAYILMYEKMARL